MILDQRLYKDFPILKQKINDNPLVYLDSAATAQRPNQVIQAVADFYKEDNANPHRGVYPLAERATKRLEQTRTTVANFIGGVASEEVIFTRGTTESINLLAYAYAPTVLNAGDTIVITIEEHHSNLVPWQYIAKRTGAQLVYLYVDDKGNISEDQILTKIDEHTKIVSFAHVSNVLGNKLPVEKLVDRAHEVGAVAVLDCAQSVPHMPVDVKTLDVDFAAFSGHKIYAPTGIGILYGKKALLNAMPPFLYGGDMIDDVQEQETTYAEIPYKFEAGTQNIGGIVGLKAAIEYIGEIGWDRIIQDEKTLMSYALKKLSKNPYISILGDASPDAERYGVISFNVQDIHPHDVASILGEQGICIRAGHHCAAPLLKYLGVPACCRASFGVYNTKKDVDKLVKALENVRGWLGYGT